MTRDPEDRIITSPTDPESDAALCVMLAILWCVIAPVTLALAEAVR